MRAEKWMGKNERVEFTDEAEAENGDKSVSRAYPRIYLTSNLVILNA